MSKPFAGHTGRTRVQYRIVVRGEIGEPLAGPLEEMRVELVDGDSLLTGDLVDQAQLQGALSMLTNLGYELVSVNPIDAL